MEDFGDNPCLSLEGDSVIACIRFVCSLYDRSLNDIVDISEARLRLFTQTLSGEKLPPTLDALALHLKRANYQYYIWKHSCDLFLTLPSLIWNGWIKVENSKIKWSKCQFQTLQPSWPDVPAKKDAKKFLQMQKSKSNLYRCMYLQ